MSVLLEIYYSEKGVLLFCQIKMPLQGKPIHFTLSKVLAKPL